MRFAPLFLLLSVASCGSDRPGVSPDAGEDARQDAIEDAGGRALELPQWTCPPGWLAVEDGSHCEPWAGGIRKECGIDEAHFPGDAHCVTLGSACPSGEWPEDLPTDRSVLYVRAGPVSSGGTGTMDDPFLSLTNALPFAREGAVVALSKGTHEEAALWLGDDVTLWGACVGETVLQQTARQGGVLKVMGEAATIRNLTIRSTAAPCVVTNALSSVSLQDLVLECTGYALDVRGDSTVTATNLEIRNTAIDAARNPLSDAAGIGMLIRSNASATLTRVNFLGGHTVGILADTGAQVALRDSVIANIESLDDGTDGLGIGAAGGSRLVVERTVLEGNHAGGIITQDAGTRAELTDLYIRNTEGRSLDGAFGRGWVLQQGATGNASRIYVAGNREIGLEVRDPGTILQLDQAVFASTRSSSLDGRFGAGVVVSLGAEMTASRVEVHGNQHWGITAISEASITVEQLVVTGTGSADCVTGSCADEVTGVGIASLSGSEVSVSNFRVDRSALAGIQVYESELDLLDGEVRSSPIGAAVSGEGFDAARLNDGVRYVDVDINLDRSSRPPPALPGALEGRRAQE